MNNNAVRDGILLSEGMRYAVLTWRGGSISISGASIPVTIPLTLRTLTLIPSATSVAPSQIIHSQEKPDKSMVEWGQLCDRVLAFTKLPQNWDGYNGKPPSVLTAVRAILLLIRDGLVAFVRAGGIDLPCPFATHGGDGSVQFEWTFGRKHFEIVVPDSDTMPILWLSAQVGPQGEEVWEGTFTTAEPDVLVRWLKWLLTEK